ncbi:MAG: DUF1449 family protein [Desulfobacterales bacterium]|nr:DUF1449 family protein [Desulfobacterales bacterium]
MVEMYTVAISPFNLPFTILLGLVLLYWVFVILGAADIDVIDMEWLPDLDADSPGGFIHGFFQFLGIGEVPIILIISILVLFGWSFAMLGTYYLNSEGSALKGFALLAANCVAAVIFTGFLIRPLQTLFSPLHKTEKEKQKVVYKTGVVISSEVNATFGQVEIATGEAPITINARADEGQVIKKGEQVIVYDEDREKGVYFVEKYNE